jgi:hypothetical protein
MRNNDEIWDALDKLVQTLPPWTVEVSMFGEAQIAGKK